MHGAAFVRKPGSKMIWNTLALGVVICFGASAAVAECRPRLLDDTEQSFVDAALQRMKPLGVMGFRKLTGFKGGEADQWIVAGLHSTMFTKADGGLLEEVGIVLSIPETRAEQQKQTLFAAFTLARLSGKPEVEIEDQIHRSEIAHPSAGTWVETFGAATAVITRAEGGLVIRMGKVDCRS